LNHGSEALNIYRSPIQNPKSKIQNAKGCAPRRQCYGAGAPIQKAWAMHYDVAGGAASKEDERAAL
jgi:hypothetical protein